jgi:hypothetical protein
MNRKALQLKQNQKRFTLDVLASCVRFPPSTKSETAGDILIEGDIAPPQKARGLLDEAEQLTAILAQSKLTAAQNRLVR